MQRTRVLLIFLFGLLCVPSSLFSHPHMFIDSEVTFVFEEEEMQGFWIKWAFDEMFTASIRLDYDFNRDGSFSAEEVEAIRNNAFQNLANYNYFTTVYRGEDRYKVEDVSNFSAHLENDRLIYRFFVPYQVEVGSQRRDLRLVIFDDTFFCDIAYFEDDPVRVEGGDQIDFSSELHINRDQGISYDPTGGRARGTNQTAAPQTNGQAFPYELQLSFGQK